jgi:DNA-directed RNA polymerase specialized sigma24 family protein
LNKPVQGNDRAAALEALCDDQRKRLVAFARIMSGGTDFEADDLFNEAALRWMKSKVPVKGLGETAKFMVGAINSIRSNYFRHDKVVRKYEGERAFRKDDEDCDPTEDASDFAASTDGTTFVQQVYNECNNEEVRDLITAQADNATPEEIKQKFGWDDTKYETVRTRKRRLVIRLMREGKIL